MGIYINGVLVNYVKPPIHFVVLLIIVLNSCGSPISLEPTAQIYEYSNLPVITPNNASSLSTLITIAGNNATEGTVAISANGKMIALAPIDSASGNTFNTGIWGTKSGELLTLLDYERNTDGNIRSLVFSLDGQFIITGSDKGVIQYWDVMSGNRVFNFTTNQNAINELAINPDGHILASVGYDNTVLVFVLETGEVKISYNHGDIVSAVAFDRTGRQLASSSSDGELIIWDLLNNTKYRSISVDLVPITDIAFHPDKSWIAVATGHSEVHIYNWDLMIRVWEIDEFDVEVVKFSADGQLLASGAGNYVNLRELATGEVLFTTWGGRSITFDREGKIMVIGNSSNIKIWGAIQDL